MREVPNISEQVDVFKSTILVVDDMATNREIAKAALDDIRYQVEDVSNGKAALSAIGAREFDMVLLDVSMAGMDGIEVLRRIRVEYDRLTLPVVMLTSNDQSADVVTALREGANDYLTKPFDAEVLRARVDMHLSHKRTDEALRLARFEAEKANRAKSEFLAKMSHELRTPLNAIIGYSEMLVEEFEDEGQDEFIPDLRKIHAAGNHLLGLINDILDLSKIEAGKMDLYLETFDVAALIDDVKSTLQPLAEKNRNAIVVECAADIGEMLNDVTKTRQILYNLISNSAKFTEDGTITLGAESIVLDGRDFIRFHVIDTGIGMNDEQAAKLFEEFVQADETISKKYGGTGLGVALVKRFSEMMGGAVHVVSKLGEGTSFAIDIPRQVVKTAAEASKPSPTPSPTSAQHPMDPGVEVLLGETDWPSGDGVKVLVVDDDPMVLSLMRRTLGREGYRVAVASGGEAAIAKAIAMGPDVITLDVVMPGMDGWSVLAALKSSQDICHIPVIMCTIMDETAHGFALGAAEYLIKPIDRRQLIANLEKFKRESGISTVLVVEDTRTTRELIGRTLAKSGWEVLEAENGKVALEILSEHRPDIIILDLMMPEMDGFEVIEHLQANKAWRKIPVIVSTAKDLSAEDRERLEGGITKIVTKGEGALEGLLAEISSAIEGPSVRDEPIEQER